MGHMLHSYKLQVNKRQAFMHLYTCFANAEVEARRLNAPSFAADHMVRSKKYEKLRLKFWHEMNVYTKTIVRRVLILKKLKQMYAHS